MPVDLPDDFIKERYHYDEKFLYIYDIYTPNYNRSIVASKFYSKYEGGSDEVDHELLEKLKTAKDRGPKDRWPWPVTSSQSYGWFCTPLVDMDRNDCRLYFPRRACEMTKHATLVLMSKVGGRK